MKRKIKQLIKLLKITRKTTKDNKIILKNQPKITKNTVLYNDKEKSLKPIWA